MQNSQDAVTWCGTVQDFHEWTNTWPLTLTVQLFISVLRHQQSTRPIKTLSPNQDPADE